jgi:hypothetical protein
MRIRYRRNVFTDPFPISGSLFLLIKNLLPSNGRRSVLSRSRWLEKNFFQSCSLAAAVALAPHFLLWANIPQYTNENLRSNINALFSGMSTEKDDSNSSFVYLLGWGETVHAVCRPLIGLLYQPQVMNGCGAFGEMRIVSENRSTRRKPTPEPLYPPQIPHDLTWTEN